MPAGGLPADFRLEKRSVGPSSDASREKLGRGQEIVPWDLPSAPGEEIIDVIASVIRVVTHPRQVIRDLRSRIGPKP